MRASLSGWGIRRNEVISQYEFLLGTDMLVMQILCSVDQGLLGQLHTLLGILAYPCPLHQPTPSWTV
jgi:hypothetical protein